MKFKRCKKCGKDKPLSAFHKDRKYGKQPCAECARKPSRVRDCQGCGSLTLFRASLYCRKCWYGKYRKKIGSRRTTPTKREIEIISLFSNEALSRGEVAQRLGISKKTVEAHMNNLHRKLGVHTRAEAANEARRRGLLSFRGTDIPVMMRLAALERRMEKAEMRIVGSRK